MHPYKKNTQEKVKDTEEKPDKTEIIIISKAKRKKKCLQLQEEFSPRIFRKTSALITL